MKKLIALPIILLLTASAQASHETRRGSDLAYSCDTVRWANTQFSRERLLELAKQYGITPKQRRQAMGCIGEASAAH
jgi:hypothetical protein